MVKVVQMLGIFMLFLIVRSQYTEKIGGSWLCRGDNPDSRCGLQCLFYPKYSGGKCINNFCQCNLRYAPENPNKDLVSNGACSEDVDRDIRCSLRCLFFKQFVRGFCQNDACMCVRR